jgi:transposase
VILRTPDKARSRLRCGQEAQGEQAPYCNLYWRSAVGAEVHPADIQDRDGAVLVIEAIHRLFPWLRHLFADSVYNGPNLHDALAKFGNWTIEIVKRAADAAGFQLLPRRWVVERTLAWLNRKPPLGKGFRGVNRQRQGVGLYRLSATADQKISLTYALQS